MALTNFPLKVTLSLQGFSFIVTSQCYTTTRKYGDGQVGDDYSNFSVGETLWRYQCLKGAIWKMLNVP